MFPEASSSSSPSPSSASNGHGAFLPPPGTGPKINGQWSGKPWVISLQLECQQDTMLFYMLAGKQEAHISAAAALINARFGGSVFEPQHRNQALPHSIFMNVSRRVLLMALTKISSDSNQSRHTCLGDMNMRSQQYNAI